MPQPKPTEEPIALKPAAFIDGGSDAAPAPPPPAAKPPAPPKHDAELLTLAKEYGIPESEANEFSPSQLVKYVARVQRATADRERAMLQATARPQQPAQPAAPKEPELDWGEDERPDPETGTLKRRKTTDDDIDPAIARVLKNFHKELLETKGISQEYSRREQEREHATVFEAVDDGFDSLGDEFAEVFGKGALSQLPEDGDERMRRKLVWDQVRQQLAGKPRPTAKAIKSMVQETAKRLFGAAAKKGTPAPTNDGGYEGGDAQLRRTTPQDPESGKFVRRQVDDDADEFEEELERKYQELGTERPTARTAPPVKQSRAAAVEGVNDKLRQWNEEDAAAEPEAVRTGGFVP